MDEQEVLLKRVMEINRDTDRHDKNIAFKLATLQILEQLTG